MRIECHNTSAMLESFEGSRDECAEKIAEWADVLDDGDTIRVFDDEARAALDAAFDNTPGTQSWAERQGDNR